MTRLFKARTVLCGNLLILFIVAAFILSACNADSDSSTATPATTAAATPAASPVKTSAEPSTDTSTEAVTEAPQPKTQRPDDATVLAAYEKACEAYDWFDMTTLPVLFDDSVEVDGSLYQRVDYPGISSMDALRTYLETLFTREVSDGLISQAVDQKHYRDIDGVLYAQAADRGANIYKGEEHLSIIEDSDTRLKVSVDVDILSEDFKTVVGTATYVFPYAEHEGKWVFETFGPRDDFEIPQ